MNKGRNRTASHAQKAQSTSWGPVANWYDELLEGKDTYQEKVVLPNLVRLVDPKPGVTILDIACGQGYFSSAFLSRGALVIGVDIAAELIEKARAHSPSGNFFVSPADDLSAVATGTMDHAVVVLAAQNIKRFDVVMGEASRTLKPGGTFTIVLNHPMFRIPKLSSWGIDQKTKQQYRRVNAYLSESSSTIVMDPGQTGAKTTVSFHRPLQWYMKHLTNSGFVVDRLEEWTSHKKSVGTHAKEENRARKEFPLFLAIRAIKAGSPR